MGAIKHTSEDNVTSTPDGQGGIVLPECCVGLCERPVEPNEQQQQQKVAQ